MNQEQLPIDPLRELQRRFAMIRLSGTYYVVELSQIERIKQGLVKESPSYMEKADAAIAMKRVLEALPIKSDPKSLIAEFWINPETRVFNRVAFDPKDESHDCLNLWTPSPIIPAKGDWSIIYDFLSIVICANQPVLLSYLLDYLAHALKSPGEKPGVMLVLLGRQGSGKGVFAQLVQRIWPTQSLLVADVKRVLGHFNDVLERSFLIILDEALFVGDKASTERLKSLLTEPRVTIEGKYQPVRELKSFHRFIATSNADHFIATDADDRRLVIYRVSTERQGDFSYFAQLVETINDDKAIAAMVFDLMRRDLTAFNVRNRPKTDELAKQKVRSLSGFRRYWFEALVLGDLRAKGRGSAYGSPNEELWSEARFVETIRLSDLYLNADPAASRFGSIQQTELHTALGSVCPSATAARRLVNDPRSSHWPKVLRRGFDLPPLEVARREFEAFLGVRVNWDNGQTLGSATTNSLIHTPFEFADAAWWTSELVSWQFSRLLPWAVANESSRENPRFLT